MNNDSLEERVSELQRATKKNVAWDHRRIQRKFKLLSAANVICGNYKVKQITEPRGAIWLHHFEVLSSRLQASQRSKVKGHKDSKPRWSFYGEFDLLNVIV